MRRTVLLGRDQARGPQQAEMFGNGGTAGPKITGKRPDGLRPIAQQAQDLTAGRIGDGAKCRVRRSLLCGNHLVTNMVTRWLRNVKGANALIA